MPRYDYLCKACGRSFEATHSFSDDPLTVCDVCGGELRKVFGNIGITFKGSGFYRNDSKAVSSTTRSVAATAAESSTPAESAASEAVPAPTSNSGADSKPSTDTKSDSKPSTDTKSDSKPSTDTKAVSKSGAE